MHNWQSIDFRESMNALLSEELLDLQNHFQLPTIIWQDNSQVQTWKKLNNFGSRQARQFSLGQEKNH